MIVILKKASKWHLLASSFGGADSSRSLSGKIVFAGGASLAPGDGSSLPSSAGPGPGVPGLRVWLGMQCWGTALGEGRALAEQNRLCELLSCFPPQESTFGVGGKPLSASGSQGAPSGFHCQIMRGLILVLREPCPGSGLGNPGSASAWGFSPHRSPR